MPSHADFRAFYGQHAPFVWRSLRRLGVPETDVADAAQEVFLVAHQRLDEFEGRAKVTTWLFRIALNVARNHRRSRQRRPETSEDIDALADEADVTSELTRRQGRAILEALLDAMPIEQRAAFVLFELEGMTADEAAETLEIPLGTVYSRVRLARQTFSQMLARRRARETFDGALGGSR